MNRREHHPLLSQRIHKLAVAPERRNHRIGKIRRVPSLFLPVDLHTPVFEKWCDNHWANAEGFSDDIAPIIENRIRYQEYKENQDGESECEELDDELGTYLEPFEFHRLLVYVEIGGNVSVRDSPFFYFQTLGYESAKEKLAQYNGCIISDSIGLGKSFMVGELLHDYHQRGDRCPTKLGLMDALIEVFPNDN